MSMAVTGVGLVSSLGFGVAGTCAGLRAGLARPLELDAEGSDGEGQAVPVVGYPASPIADGFTQLGAWVQLACGALSDLRHAATLPPDSGGDFWGGTALSAALPRIDVDRYLWSLADLPDAPDHHFLGPVTQLSVPGIGRAPRLWFASGHVSAAAALLAAERTLSERLADRCLLVAADTYVDPSSLAWLASANRLKSGEQPTGLMPGEAGAALLVESRHSARLRKAPLLGSVEAIAVGAMEPQGPPDPKRQVEASGEADAGAPRPPAPALGRALAEAVRKVLPPVRADERFRGDLYLDLNGEDWRARAWGHAQVLLSRRVDLDRCRTFVPAISLGETGAASAPIGVAWALYNLSQDQTEHALVLSMGDDGTVAAIRIGSPGRSG